VGKKLLRPGKVVVVLAGRYAGKKAIIVKTFDEGHGDRKFGHCIVAGLERVPKKVTKSMSAKKVKGRSRNMKPFIRAVNFNHILPTRYQVDMELKKVTLKGKEGKEGETINLDESTLKDKPSRDLARKALRTLFRHEHDAFDAKKEGKGKVGEHYFYTKLRF
jgi:large subunit ribosomal protein L27e